MLYRRQEIVNLVADAEADTTDSPEIGPPPVSQFVDEDPVKIDLPRRTKKEDVQEPSSLDPTLSVNLEQRRKRKDSSITVEPRKSIEKETVHEIKDTEPSLKSGAKRKLSVRDDEENDRPLVPPSPDNFKFTRVKEDDKLKNKVSTQQERTGIKPIREIAVARGALRDKQNTSAVSTTRKALAPKSINNSPKKNTRVSLSDAVKPFKPDGSLSNVAKEHPQEDRLEIVRIQPTANVVTKPNEVQPEPETPAAIDIFSPSSSQPSTNRVDSRDTPPPVDFGSGADGQRPSRRARGAVSYAEPNLRDKMRRPTKDLVDAVTKEERAQRANAIKLEEATVAGLGTIKSEPEANDAWKSMPAASTSTVENSPLSSKAPETLPSSITTHRKRRESILSETEPNLASPSSRSAVAALLAESRRARGIIKEEPHADDNELTKGIEKLDIYDFKASPTIHAAVPEKGVKADKPVLRFSRRHPAIPQDVVPSDSEASDMEGSKKTEFLKSRRRQSSLGLKSSRINPELPKATDGTRSLTRSTSAASMAEGEQAGSRNDRISARRRSMML